MIYPLYMRPSHLQRQEGSGTSWRCTIHPKHGSWLDMAEIELSVFSKQCLNRRIDSMEKLHEEATAWYSDRNSRQKLIDWQFTIGDARIRLKHLYPVIELKN
jgi:recombinational DNA repair ATPase RecF